MGSILLNNLKNAGKAKTGYTYVDLHLDIEESTVSARLANTRIRGKDILVDYDVDAIVNSLVNIFQTVPGERFLIPKFGANLRKYLFASVSEFVGRQIGNEIYNAIQLWEPRVTVDRIDVIARPDAQEYEVTIQITINALQERIKLLSVLDQTSDITFKNVTRICPT